MAIFSNNIGLNTGNEFKIKYNTILNEHIKYYEIIEVKLKKTQRILIGNKNI